MRVLLTGCEGFIGKRINDTLMKHTDVISVVGIQHCLKLFLYVMWCYTLVLYQILC